MPYRPSKLACDISAQGKLVGPRTAAKKRGDFDPQAFLATIGEGRKFELFPKKQRIFAQGDTADAVFHIQTGNVRLTVVSNDGKEATIGIFILGDGEFSQSEACAPAFLRA